MNHGQNLVAASSRPFKRVASLLGAVPLALLLLGLSSARLPHAGPGAASAGSASSLTTVTMPIQTCPSFHAVGSGPPLASLATDVSVLLPSDAPDAGGSFQAWGTPSTPPAVLIGPADFTCMSIFAGDGGLIMYLLGPDEGSAQPCGSPPGAICLGDYFYGPIVPTDSIKADFRPSGGAMVAVACPYFPALQTAMVAYFPDCSRPLPPGQAVQSLDANSVAFYQPADDSHPSPTFGVVVSDVVASEGRATGTSTEATCTLPASSSSVCKSVLIAFLTGWGQSSDPAADAAAMALDTLSWFAPNS